MYQEDWRESEPDPAEDDWVESTDPITEEEMWAEWSESCPTESTAS